VWDLKGMVMCKLAFARLWLADQHHSLSGTTVNVDVDMFSAIGKAFNVTAKYTHKFDTGKIFSASYVCGAVHQASPIAGWLQQRWLAAVRLFSGWCAATRAVNHRISYFKIYIAFSY
jgi:hypothetical protein